MTLDYTRRAVCALVLILPLASCGDSAKLTEAESTGTSPKIVSPTNSWFPTLTTPKAQRWPAAETPIAADGLAVKAFATDLDHPRWIYSLPNGDVLAAETNSPERLDDGKGPKGWVMSLVQGWGGLNVKSANRIMLLRDQDGDGVAETRSVFLSGLNSPFGMVLIGNKLYVANTDALMQYDYVEGETVQKNPGWKVADLPAGSRNHHWTKNIIASPDNRKIFVTVGSNSNAGENGIAEEERRAAILEVDIETGRVEVLASGLRNPNGMSYEPETGKLWTVVNERDELGSDLVPDYLTEVVPGEFYGFPWSYWGQHVDTRVKPERPDLVAKARTPDYALGNHVAPLGLVFSVGAKLPDTYKNVAFVSEHGSWNRRPPSGYKVVAITFSGGRPAGHPQDVLTGFLTENGQTKGRPVGLTVHRSGALLVSDDVGRTIWRVTAK